MNPARLLLWWVWCTSLAASAAKAQDSDPSYWDHGRPRPFLASRSELGIPYAKPSLSVGYGKPHWLWAGADVSVIATTEFLQSYANLRAASPLVDLSFGVRDTLSFGKTLLTLPPFTRGDVASDARRDLRYQAWEGEVLLTLPLPYSALVGDLIVVKILGVPPDRFVYDESYRVVVSDSSYFVWRMAAVARMLRRDALKVGLLVVHIFDTGRPSTVWQLGPAGALQLTDHLEAIAALAFGISGPDDLGLTLGSYGVAGLRYRWATGERDPRLPWAGELVF